MLGRLNIYGMSLLVGAMGLCWFYSRMVAAVPKWIVCAALLLPWLVVHTITFCNVAPFGPKPFRRCLLAAVCAYLSLTLTAEVLQFAYRLPPDGRFPVAAARALMYAGCLGCIPLARAYLVLRGISTDAT